MLAIRQVPPWRTSRSWRWRISSSSPVRLKAYITFFPVRSAWALITRITASTRSSNGQCGPFACNSSSLMKSMPPSHSDATSDAVSAGPNPTLGLMMVPISGRCSTPVRRRVPSMPKRGPPYRSAKDCGRRMSSTRRPVNCRSSNRLPPTVASMLGKDGPRFSIGQDNVTRARRSLVESTAAVVGNEAAATGSSRISSVSMRAAERSFNAGVSPGTGTNVPLDCSPAIISTARRGSMLVSIR